MELITDPSILFLDEPTTGLDSSTANAVLLLLKRCVLPDVFIYLLSGHLYVALCILCAGVNNRISVEEEREEEILKMVNKNIENDGCGGTGLLF